MGSLSPARGQSAPVHQARLRADQGFRAGRAHVYGAELPRRTGYVAGEHRAGAGRAGHGEPGQAQLRLRRGPGSSQHLFGVMFNTATRSTPSTSRTRGHRRPRAGLIAGQVDYMLDPPTCLPFVTAGRMKALAVAAPQRNPRIAERADARRAGHHGCLHAHLLRRRGAGRNAQGDRHEAEHRDQRDPQHGRHARAPRQARGRAREAARRRSSVSSWNPR